MAAAPRTGPGCLGSPPAQAPSSSLAGVQGAPKRLGVSKPSWIVRTELYFSAKSRSMKTEGCGGAGYRTATLELLSSGDLFIPHSNVRRERPKRPDPPCTICKGTGRIDCRNCFGRGRTNHANLIMLPKGEWPQWCRICGGSGLDYCLRCHGTGEYREPMGFHFTVQRK